MSEWSVRKVDIMPNTTIIEPTGAPAEKQAWRKPTLSEVGCVTRVVRGGGGKLSIIGGDPGEGRKQKGGVG